MGLTLNGTPDVNSIRSSNYTVKIAVGYSDEDMHYSGKSMAELGEAMEAGDYKTPARPHLEEGIENDLGGIKEAVKEYRAQKRLHVKGFSKDASGIGMAMVEAVKEYVYSGALAPNAPYTIAKKGSDQPLVDTGDLMNSLTYKVTRMSDNNG